MFSPICYMKAVLQESTKKDRKYMATFVHNGKKRNVHFGTRASGQYEDRTGLGLYSHLDHHDEHLRQRMLASYDAKKNNPLEPAYWATRYLWGADVIAPN